MSRFGRSAESAFFAEQRQSLSIPTGELFERRFVNELLNGIAAINEKRKAGDKPKIHVYPHRPGNANDLFRGTDLKIVDFEGAIGRYTGHLRFDITHDFTGKDNMPLIAVQHDQISICNGRHPIQMGVRIGNNAAAFDDPVIVVGIDAAPSEIKAIEDEGRFQTELRKKAPAILRTAGQTLQEYVRLTDPDYRSFMERNKDKIPEPGITLKAVRKGRSEILNHRAKWYTPFASKAKELVSATIGAELVPIGGDAPKYGYIARLNQKVAAADARDKAEEETLRSKRGIDYK